MGHFNALRFGISLRLHFKMKVQLCFVVIVAVLQLKIVHSSITSNFDRQEPPMPPLNHCCNSTEPGHTEISEKLDKLKEECEEELGETEFICVCECVSKKLGVVSIFPQLHQIYRLLIQKQNIPTNFMDSIKYIKNR